MGTARLRGATAKWLTACINLYLAGLLAWFGLWATAGERIAAVEVVSQLAVWFFVPLIAVVPLCLVLKARFTRGAAALATMLFLWLWGGLLLPRSPTVHAANGSLTILTYNALGPQSAVEASLAVIRGEQADVVAIQELNSDLARALGRELRADYPYQVLDPDPTVLGMGVISKYPLVASADRLPLSWVGVPQLLTLDWHGQPVSVINFHAWPPQTGGGTYAQLEYVLRIQAQQGEALAAYARAKAAEGPVVAVGDANATTLSALHRRVTSVLADSWQEVGWGLGHTWGGSKLPQTPLGPLWIARIDHVFHSGDLVALDAYLAKYDGASDHRGVVVKLAARST